MKNNIVKFVYYAKVDVARSDYVEVTDVDSGHQFRVRGEELISGVESTDKVGTTKTLTPTKLAELMHNLTTGTLFTAEFVKKNGDKRVLRGRFLHPDYQGRVHVEDLDLGIDEHRERQVDLRTLSYVITGNTKYVARKR